MSAVMMDNWSIESAVEYLGLEDECSEQDYNKNISSWCHFLTAIILWDEIWYYDNSTSRPWQRRVEEEQISSSLLKQILYSVNEALADNEIITTLEHHVRLEYEGSPVDFISQRNYFYQLLSNSLGVNLLLHEKRMLQNYTPPDKKFTRLDIFNRIDRELEEYYKYLNSLAGREFRSFKYPVLFDYSRYLISEKRSNNKISEIEAVMEIRQDKDIVRFRDEISHLDVIINNGDNQALRTQFNVIHEAAEGITNKYNKKINLGEMTITYSPTISFSISKTIPLSIKYNKNMKIHTSFINRIIEFGIYQRYPYTS